MVREENRALFEQLRAESRRITGKVDNFRIARSRMAESRETIRLRSIRYRSLRTSIQTKTLTRTIRSDGEFEGGCAEGLRDRHRETRALLDGREERISALISALDSQLSLIDSKISELSARQSNISSQIRNL